MWASGNGGVEDDCSADGYVSNIRTISIGAINDHGLSAYFVESCPSTMAAVVSGGPSDFDPPESRRRTRNLVVRIGAFGQGRGGRCKHRCKLWGGGGIGAKGHSEIIAVTMPSIFTKSKIFAFCCFLVMVLDV